MTSPVFRTRRLELRPLQMSDFSQWRATLLAASLRPPRRFDIPTRPSGGDPDRATFRKQVARWRRRRREDQLHCFGIFHRATGEYLGHTDIRIIERGCQGWANLGYAIHSPHYGHGYGREAARATVEFAFRRLNLHRLEAVIDPANRRSIRLARAIGMRREATRRGFEFEGGRWRDQVVYAVIPEDIGRRSRSPS